jgi:pimeloyl-ACP methyl ester carboxylesterase
VTRADAFLCLALSCSLPTAAFAAMPEPTMIEVAGAAFPMVTAGMGEPILFVHGALGDYRKWDGLWQDVAASHRFMAYTQRWHGTSVWPEGAAYSRDTQADDLIAILHALGEPVNLVGLSNGGPVVLRAALQAPDLVRSVTLYEPNLPEVLLGSAEGRAALDTLGQSFGEAFEASAAGDEASAARRFVEALYTLPEGGFETLDPVQRAMVLDNAHTLAMMWNAPDPTPLTCAPLGEVTAPTMVIHGSKTFPAFELAAKAVADCVPNARLATLDGVGHIGPVVAKDAFVALLLGFVDAQ